MIQKTPYGRVHGLGSAKSGTGQWWMERVTSVASLPLVLATLACIVYHVGASRAEVLASFQNPYVAIIFALTVVTVAWHMQLGMKVIIEDYVHGPALKFALLLANTFYSIGIAAIGLYAILRMNFGL
jgi:succinate dehydrogenase / fumarate reductase membrane anchor subunit